MATAISSQRKARGQIDRKCSMVKGIFAEVGGSDRVARGQRICRGWELLWEGTQVYKKLEDSEIL